MTVYKPVIEISKTDITCNRILDGLIKNREYHINNITPEKKNLLVKIGIGIKPLNLEYPIIWYTPKAKHNGKRLLKLPPNLEIIKEIGEKKICYQFRRIS